MRSLLLHEQNDFVDTNQTPSTDAGQIKDSVLGEDGSKLVPIAVVDRIAIPARDLA